MKKRNRLGSRVIEELGDEFGWCDYALAVSQGLVSLVLVHDGLALVAARELVVAASHQQVRVWEPAGANCRSK
jgi:hypothetical protein